MKKLLSFILCAVLLVSLTACGSSAPQNPAEKTRSTEPVKNEFMVGETWIVDGQWELTVTGFEETPTRNEFSDKTPGAVYNVYYTYKNVGYKDANGLMNGLFFSLDFSIIDAHSFMGYSYPGDITDFPQETPVGASCKAQVCIGVDNAGLPIKLQVFQYDGNGVERTATFVLK